MSNPYLEHFKKEWTRLEKWFKDTQDIEVYRDFKHLFKIALRIWESEGHSGALANFFAKRLADIFKNALLFRPLVPIENEEEFDF